MVLLVVDLAGLGLDDQRVVGVLRGRGDAGQRGDAAQLYDAAPRVFAFHLEVQRDRAEGEPLAVRRRAYRVAHDAGGRLERKE